jgi:hypothetical protein
MLDTINHLLDWTNINNFMKTSEEKASISESTDSKLPSTSQNTPFTDELMRLTSCLGVDALVEEVVDCVYAGHTYQQQSIRRLGDQRSLDELGGHPHSRLDALETLNEERLGEGIISRASQSSEGTLVMLDIDPTVE